MALTVINGLRTVGTLGTEYYGERTKDFFLTLKAGNSAVERGTIPFLSWIESKTKPIIDNSEGKRNHFLGTKGATFSYTDVYDAVDLLKSYRDASPMKPFALANTRTIQNTVASSLEWSANKDEYLVEGLDLKYRNALGCSWVDMDTYLPEGIIIFLDAQSMDLIIKAESPDKEQRGIAFVKTFGGEMHKLESAEDLAGGTVQVFPVEQFIAKRHLGVILDTMTQGQTTSDYKKGWAQEATITKLETFAKNLRESYTVEMK